MIPISIKMHNFLSYQNETPVFDFTTFHIACISGDNGAGKSSFLEAIHWALWGEARLSSGEIMYRGAERMSVEFVFAVNDVVYRINRSYAKSTRAGTRLELYQAADAERTRWDSLTGGTMRDTQAKITDDIVGMSYEVFSNSAYLRQGQADAFTRLAPTERRDLLAQMLEIDQYNIFRDRAKSKRDVLAREIANIQGQMAVDEANVTNIPGLSSQLQDADARVAQARSFVAYANAAVSRQTARQSLQQLDNQLALYTQRYADVTTEMAAAQAQLALRADIEARYAAYVAVEERFNTLNSMRAQYDSLTAQKQEAEQRIAQRRAIIERTLDRANAEREQLRSALADADARSREAAELDQAIAEADADETQLKTVTAQRDTLLLQIRDAQRTLDRIQALTLEIERAEAQQAVASERLVGLPLLHEQLAHYEAADARSATLQTERADVTATHARLTAEHKATTDAGIALKEKRNSLSINEKCPTCQTLMDEAHYHAAQDTLQHEIDALRTSYAQQSAAVKTTLNRIQEIETSLQECATLSKSAPDIRRRIAALTAEHLDAQRLESTLTQLRTQRNALTEPAPEQSKAAAEQTIRELDTQIQHYTVKAATRAANQRRAAQLAIELATIESQKARIASLDGSIAGFETDLAQNRIDTESQELLSVVLAQLAALDYDPVLVGALWTELQGLQQARADYAQLAVMIERATALAQRSADTAEQLQLASHTKQQAEHELKRIEERCVELLPLLGGRDVSAPPAQLVSMADVDLNSRTDYASQLRVKLQSAYQSQSRLEAFHSQLQTATVLHGRYDTLEKAFASKGLQAMLIRDFAVPALERETNRILSRMTDNQLYLNVNTSATSQTGNARETLELAVSDAAGTRPLEAFSGGEAFRISFALRIALSRLLAHRAGHRLETLIIDEGFGTQDAQGRERLVEAINAISADFRTIMVITHVAEVRDLFPVQITIKRDEHGSSWEVRA